MGEQFGVREGGPHPGKKWKVFYVAEGELTFEEKRKKLRGGAPIQGGASLNRGMEKKFATLKRLKS